MKNSQRYGLYSRPKFATLWKISTFLQFKCHFVTGIQNCEKIRFVWSGQVRYEGIRRSSASPRPPCDGTHSASVGPSPRQTPGPSCPYPSDRTPPDATMKRVDARGARHGPAPRISTRKNPMSGILRRESRHMPIEA